MQREESVSDPPNPIPEPTSAFVARYNTVKHSWKGKYKRIFSIGCECVATVNPGSWEVTNKWDYFEEFIDILPNPKSHEEFTIYLKKAKGISKTQTLVFSCSHRSDLLTHIQKFRDVFLVDKNKARSDLVAAKKLRWNSSKVDVYLSAGHASLDQIEFYTKKTLCSYNYQEITKILFVSDVPGGFVIVCRNGRMHHFSSDNRDNLIKSIIHNAKTLIGIDIQAPKESITREQFELDKFGKYGEEDAITSLSEFRIQKFTPRHEESVSRIFGLSEKCIVERDPGTYAIVTIKAFQDIFSLIRYNDDLQKFGVEYKNGIIRRYNSTDRDSLLASLLDSVRGSGNREVCVKMNETVRFNRIGPWDMPVEEEIQILFLKTLATYNESIGLTFDQLISRFNVNIDYSGPKMTTLLDSKESELISSAINAIFTHGQQGFETSASSGSEQFECIRRLVACKAGYELFTKLENFRTNLGKRIVQALKMGNDGVIYAAVDVLGALMQPMHDFYDLLQEQLNKKSLMMSRSFITQLAQLLGQHAQAGTGALVVSSLLDFFTYALCEPYSNTTEGQLFDITLEVVSDLGRKLFKLFQHPSMAIIKGTGLLMRAMIEEAPTPVLLKMQTLSLSEGALLKHLLTAMFTNSNDPRLLTNRELSRQLVSLWCDGNPAAMELLKGILPAGLVAYLFSSETPPEIDSVEIDVRGSKSGVRPKKVSQVETLVAHWKNRSFFNSDKNKPPPKSLVIRARKVRERQKLNWLMLYYQMYQEHTRADLIWNFRTREELKEALETELRAFNVDKELGGIQSKEVCWNFLEFEVKYESLSEELKIGDNFVRLLLEQGITNDLPNPQGFFFDLYHRFLLATNSQMRAMCLQAMSIVYGKCYSQIGPFNDTSFIVKMLAKASTKIERDRLLQFLDKLLLVRDNSKAFIDTGGVRLLVGLATLSHLHTDRATTPLQSNLIESGDIKREMEKEWYVSDPEKKKLGPFGSDEMKELYDSGKINADTKCWAQGLDGWRKIPEIVQLKWTLMDTGPAILNETELAGICLSILYRVCEMYPSKDEDGAVVRPLPRIKRILSDATCLPHLVNILLTFDPILVEKIGAILDNVMQDNPVVPNLFSTGAFLFTLMYTGSNITSITRFLESTHLKQAFKVDEEDVRNSQIHTKSILGPIIPKAMICYLENYGAQKFAEVFLGNFDTPEAIWSHEMRRFMIEKIATHISEFSPRLLSNTQAIYQYCPIPRINYPELEHELFCNIYYLRNLCDVSRFPSWEIKNHIELLKDILDAWKREVSKKPASMSVEEAYTVLGLEKGKGHSENVIRRAYFKLAAQYHPDKNPDGREMFEKVNKAYEFLSASEKLRSDGPDPENIVLILRGQSILFSRYPDILRPYKYAGYPMLIKTIQMETADERLFSKPVALLPSACELTYHTVNVSALNAEELRRESGFEILAEAFSRCIDVVSPKTNPKETSVQVCTHLVQTFGASSQFEKCREKLIENTTIVKNVARCLHFKGSAQLTIKAIECLISFSVSSVLQDMLASYGSIWHLMLMLFDYDYTLEEGGVESSIDTNQQQVSNTTAKLAIRALAKLGGYMVGEEATPSNEPIKAGLSNMLTYLLNKQLAEQKPLETLKLFTINSETPYLIWNNSTRAELQDYLTLQQSLSLKGSEHDTSLGANFIYSDLAKELRIGNVYVRIYNKQPTFPLEDPSYFCAEVLGYLRKDAEILLKNPPSSDSDSPRPSSLKTSKMALEALRNVIKNNPGVEKQTIGKYKLIFFFLRIDDDTTIQQLALECINAVCISKDCVNAISEAQVIGNLTTLLHTSPTTHELLLETMQALASNPKAVAESISKGGVLFLLELYCCSTNPTTRIGSASVLAKMCSDKLHGPKVAIIMGKFLPSVFTDAMRENPEASIHLFEGSQENPELIWDDEARKKIQEVVIHMSGSFCKDLLANPNEKWTIPDDFEVIYSNITGEVVVGGVFVRLFIKQPNWALRNPKQFVISLFERYFQLCNSSASEQPISIISEAIVLLLATQGQLSAYLTSVGIVPRFFAASKVNNEFVVNGSINIVHSLSFNETAVESFGQTNSIETILFMMKAYPKGIATIAEALKNMFEKISPEKSSLVKQVIDTQLVKFLLNVLDNPLPNVPNAPSVKAQIVNALKAMANNIEFGPQITATLDESSVWNAYRDQKHDLFITSEGVKGLITGPVAATKGYLTAAPTTAPPMIAPPDDD